MAPRTPKGRRFYRVKGGRRKRRRRRGWLLAAGGVVILTWVLIFGETGWLRVRAEERVLRELQAEHTRLETSIESLDARIVEIRDIHVLEPTAEGVAGESEGGD